MVPVSGLLAVVSMACVLKRRSVAFVSKRLFCAIAYLPKATVQAAIGIDLTYRRLLQKESRGDAQRTG